MRVRGWRGLKKGMWKEGWGGGGGADGICLGWGCYVDGWSGWGGCFQLKLCLFRGKTGEECAAIVS